MLTTLVIAFLTTAPPLDFVRVPDPGGEFTTSCRRSVNGTPVNGRARLIFVRAMDGKVVFSDERPRFRLPPSDVEPLRRFVFDDQGLGQEFAEWVRWPRDRTWNEYLVTGVVPFGRGRLVALNGGEYGGGLVWVTDQDVTFLNGFPTNGLARDGQDVVVASGTDHGFGSSGGLLRIRDVEGTPEVVARYELPFNARAVASRDRMVVVATETGPVVIDQAGILHRRATNHTAFMDDRSRRRHPHTASSVAIDADGAVHVGLSGGYAIYPNLPDSFEYEYYALADPCRGRGTPR